MGKVEKIVVLSVLFLIVLILAISLNTSGGGPNGLPDAREEALARLTGERGGPADPTQPAVDPAAALEDIGAPIAPRETLRARRPGTPSDILAFEPEERQSLEEHAPGLLNAGVREASGPALAQPQAEIEAEIEAEPEAEPTATIPRAAEWDLRTTVGMSRTVVDTLLVYTCQDGDTFEGLAQRFYGDRAKSQLLRLNNEGLEHLSAATKILVPVHDDSGEIHRVTENESLWAIAATHYGDGTRWPEIFEANRHLLDQPKDLRPGMQLTIP